MVSADDAVRAAGLRVTVSRRAAYDALRGMPHISAEAVLLRVRESYPDANLQSVYNALTDFVGAGIVRRIEPEGRPGLYELRVGDNHHHVVCTGCGAIADVDCVIGAAPCLTPSDAPGFVVQSAEVTFWGRCAACATSLSSDVVHP